VAICGWSFSCRFTAESWHGKFPAQRRRNRIAARQLFRATPPLPKHARRMSAPRRRNRNMRHGNFFAQRRRNRIMARQLSRATPPQPNHGTATSLCDQNGDQKLIQN
jgi:hypothetical protein